MAYVNVKECLTSPRQLIKLICLIVCVCITIYQLSECVRKLVNPPITSYYKFDYNETIKYPALTICRRPGYQTSEMSKFGMSNKTTDLLKHDVFKRFSFDNYTIEEFMNATTYRFESVVPLLGYKTTGSSDISNGVTVKRTFYPSRGQCYTIVPKEDGDKFSAVTGYWLYLMHSTKDKSRDSEGLSVNGFEIHIHDHHDVIKEKQVIDTGFLYVETLEDMFVTLSVQMYNQISTSQQPCVAAHAYSKSKCEEECIHNAIAEETGCSVPWLRSLKKSYPECKNYSIINQIGSLITLHRKSNFLQKCYCKSSCKNAVYKYTIESRKEGKTLDAPASLVNIYYPSNLVTELTEVISYDWNSFLAEVGGSLGFLLGLSVIGIVAVVEELLRMILKRSNDEDEAKKEKRPRSTANGDGESLNDVTEFVANCDMYQHLQHQITIENKKIKH